MFLSWLFPIYLLPDQEVPDWLEQLAYTATQFRATAGRGRRRGGGQPYNFSARDHRQSQAPRWTSQTYTHSWRDREHTPATPAMDRFGHRPPISSPTSYVNASDAQWAAEDQSRFIRGGSNVGTVAMAPTSPVVGSGLFYAAPSMSPPPPAAQPGWAPSPSRSPVSQDSWADAPVGGSWSS